MPPRHSIIDSIFLKWYKDALLGIPDENCGGVAEWSKAAVLKTVELTLRGFESYLLRQFLFLHNKTVTLCVTVFFIYGRRSDREADGARLLSECSLIANRGFESLLLRQFLSQRADLLFGFFCCQNGDMTSQ